jgi:hypothetical protein
MHLVHGHIPGPSPFVRQLGELLLGAYSGVRRNVQERMQPILDSCISEPALDRGSDGVCRLSKHWEELLGTLDKLAQELQELQLPGRLAPDLFSQVLGFMDAHMFNGLSGSTHCCCPTNGRYVLEGLEQVGWPLQNQCPPRPRRQPFALLIPLGQPVPPRCHGRWTAGWHAMARTAACWHTRARPPHSWRLPARTPWRWTASLPCAPRCLWSR